MIVRRFKKIGRNEICPCGSEDLFLDVYELYDLYTSGKTLDELGELIGRSRKTISKLFIKHNLAIRNKSEVAMGENNSSFSASEHRKEHSLPNDKWSRDYEKCTRCGSTSNSHASHGLCTKCNQYDRTVSQRGYEREYDLDGKRIFSQEHIEKLKQARIIVAQRKKFKKCECSKDIETIKYINLSKK